ncbi:transporter substrate-binding domain-containing protein [Lyngbya sp. CCY1209]|uniref:transporter substrate-binding domain-containing protein n=1 Tax=Lyngbya sp. CCY1209 TaxID=2886103 RepID=UPI002D1FFD41|nr:transporter substrate-binding domain-containing protein [Lyngbya sp. CCY1209]MEB3887142.1 transporter substrate-binding domain-containing protein [Lyngbya sp. CCY1209]
MFLKLRLRKILVLVNVAIAGSFSFQEPAPAQSLRVGVAGSAPFVIVEDSTIKGISIDIWQDIAQMENLEYQLIEQKTVSESLTNLQNGNLDLAIGSISITADRAEEVAFTQAFYLAEIAILTENTSTSLWQKIRPFFTIAVLSSIVVLMILLFIVGNLLWLAERDRNSEQFPKSYRRGVGNGMWCALVTLTTVGYGDYTPVTPVGRAIAGIWMIVTMLTASSLTAGLATAFTLSFSDISSEKFTRPEDLQNTAIAAVVDTTGAKWATDYGANLRKTKSLQEAVSLLEEGQVEGVVFDKPALQYYLNQNPELDLKFANFKITIEAYGFALPPNSPLRQKLNVAILELSESGRIEEIANIWLNANFQPGKFE